MIAPGQYEDSSENSTDDRENRRILSDAFFKPPFNDDEGGENEQYSLVSDNNLDLDKPSSIDEEKTRLRNKSMPNIMNKCYATRTINQNNSPNDDNLSQCDRQMPSYMDDLSDANKILYNKIPTHSSNLRNYLSGSGVLVDDNDGSAGIETNSSPNNNLIDEFIEDILPPPPGLPKKENSARLRRYRLE
jgi:hypothetical protein